MRFTTCPLCKAPTATGSHWDCIFEMLEHYAEQKEKAATPPSTGDIDHTLDPHRDGP